MTQQRCGSHRIRHLRSGVAFLATVALAGPVPSAAQQPTPPREVYDALMAAFNDGRTLMGRDNLSGAIVWGESHVLNSLMDMYRATGDEAYLRTFVEHGDAVMEKRDDLVGRTGWDQSPRLGWSTGGGYTFGRPIVLRDGRGEPALELRGIHWADNHRTEASVRTDGGEAYDLVVVNDANGDEYRRVYEGLTQATVEERLNAQPTLQSLVIARRLGSRPPAETYEPIRFTPETVALTVFHNGFILTPFARFSEEVLGAGLTEFEAPAARYLAAARGAWAQADRHWEDHDEFGFYRVRPDVPFWPSGLAAPVNVQAAHGLLSLHLAQATGEFRYRYRTRQILELVRRITREAKGGAHTIHYLFGEGYTGWGPPSGVPRPFGTVYARYGGRTVIEDASHGARSALLVGRAARYGFLEPEYLAGWVETARFMLPPDVLERGGTPRRLPGAEEGGADDRGTHDIVAPSWAVLGAAGGEDLYDQTMELYRARFETRERSAAVLLGWAQLAWLASERSRERE